MGIFIDYPTMFQYGMVKGIYPVARVGPAFLAVTLLAAVFVVFGVVLGVRNNGWDSREVGELDHGELYLGSYGAP